MKQGASRILECLDDSPYGYVAPVTNGKPDGKHRRVGGEKEEGRGADAEAHGIESDRDSARDSEVEVSLDAHVVVGVTGPTKDFAWRGQYPSSSQATGRKGVEPLLELYVERGRVNSL